MDVAQSIQGGTNKNNRNSGFERDRHEDLGVD